MRTGGLALAAIVLAGCLGAPAAEDAPPTLRCDPCAVAIDAGVRWEPMVAVDPTDPRHVVAASQDETPDAAGRRDYWPLSHVSFDGGATWTTTRLPGGPGAAPTHPLAKYNGMGDPVPAFLPDGTLLWAAIADARVSRPGVPYEATGDDLVVLRSTDGGRTFPESTVVQAGSGAYGSVNVVPDIMDKEWLTVGPDGTALLAWVRNRAEPTSPIGTTATILAATSKDGRAWTAPVVVTAGRAITGPFPLILDDGAWLVAYVDRDEDALHVARSTDAGATWDDAALDTATKNPWLAHAAGRVYVAYPKTADGPDAKQTPTLRGSDDGGRTWSDALALDAPEADGRTTPAVVALRDGGAIATYWHAREDESELRAVMVREGQTSAPLVLGTTEGTPRATGDYMGLAATADGGAWAVWNALQGQGFTVTGARVAVG